MVEPGFKRLRCCLLAIPLLDWCEGLPARKKMGPLSIFQRPEVDEWRTSIAQMKNNTAITKRHRTQPPIEDAMNSNKEAERADIAANGYNIAVSSYVEQEDTRKSMDIQTLNTRIAGIVARQTELRTQIDAIVVDLEGQEI